MPRESGIKMSTHIKHRIRQNSVIAHGEERKRLSRRADEIINVYARARRPLRDREVMQALGFIDMNAVRPSITALIDKTILREVGDSIDPATRKTVRLVALQTYKDPQMKICFREKVEGGRRQRAQRPESKGKERLK
jgi:hypothetical protein